MTQNEPGLDFLALGGSGEIGMNLNLYRCDDDWLMIDCGSTFARGDEHPGVDILVPDIAFLEQDGIRPSGILLTHAHEDHLGALPYLLDELDTPIFANRFTLEILRNKLSRAGMLGRASLIEVPIGARFSIGPFAVELLPLAHSIPDMCAALICTRYGRVLHTGDWKFDADPVIALEDPRKQLKEWGDKGVLALVGDSTNALSPQSAGSERSVVTQIEDLVQQAPGRVVVATFASNAARLQSLGEIAKRTGRHIAFAGMSFDKIISAAQNTGYLENLPRPIALDHVASVPPEKLMVIASGAQGEPNAALARMAQGTHPVPLDPGDLVILSSRTIPGNETALGAVLNDLAMMEVSVASHETAHLHVSGHPGRPDLTEMLELVRPRMVIPVHGEARHLAAHRDLAASIDGIDSLLQLNGDLIRLAPDGPRKVASVPSGRLAVDGGHLVPADGRAINERRKMASQGVVSIAVFGPVAGPLAAKVIVAGVVPPRERGQFSRQLAAAVLEVANRKADVLWEGEIAREVLAITMSKTGKSPLILIHVTTR